RVPEIPLLCPRRCRARPARRPGALTVEATVGESTPEISVVILAFDRTNLLAGALRSVMSQEFPRDRFEVLVVANVVDAAVKSEFEPQGVRFLLSTQKALGAKVAEGSEAARGRILCLLEDDDRYLPGKLAQVARRFREDPSLGFYHNAFRTVGPDGAPWLGTFHRDEAARQIARRGQVYRPANSAMGDWAPFAGIFPGFNNSCIALRRAVFGPWWGFVARSDLISDECLFLAAAASGAAILQDREVLTELMVHAGSISNPVSGVSEFEVDRLRTFSERNARSRRVLIDLAHQSRRSDLIEMAEAEVAMQDLVGCLRDPRSSRGNFAAPLRIVLRRRRTLSVWNYPSVAALAAGALLSPAMARMLYRGLKRVGG
ncbi:MAG: glycosyltransferase family 2 protein, partial [Thermoplasmata archaeon]|nr:glycosyltransferase family 2 protein [Thermoplasmata archaeon]